MAEFVRLGISGNVNRFSVIESKEVQDRIPEITFTPRMELAKIKKVASVRKLGRIPTVVYVDSSNKGTGCAIWRSSEPKNDILKVTCEEDKEYIQMMSQIQAESEQDS